jgi:NADH:ubiquinone oxidoreductase subunit 3 (subunit A)
MANLLLPPFSLVVYLPFVTLILILGKKLAGPEHPSKEKSRTYGGGESAHKESSIPGYSPFILIAFFFALLHIGILVLGTSSLQWSTAIYIAGLALCLVALILG